MAPSNSGKGLLSVNSPKHVKQNSELFDERGNLIDSEAKQQTFGHQLKEYMEKNKHKSMWFTGGKPVNQDQNE